MSKKTEPTLSITLEKSVFERCKLLYCGIKDEPESEQTFSFEDLVNELVHHGLRKYRL